MSLNDPHGEKGKRHVLLMEIDRVPLETKGQRQKMRKIKCDPLGIEIFFGNQTIPLCLRTCNFY